MIERCRASEEEIKNDIESNNRSFWGSTTKQEIEYLKVLKLFQNKGNNETTNI